MSSGLLPPVILQCHGHGTVTEELTDYGRALCSQLGSIMHSPHCPHCPLLTAARGHRPLHTGPGSPLQSHLCTSGQCPSAASDKKQTDRQATLTVSMIGNRLCAIPNTALHNRWFLHSSSQQQTHRLHEAVEHVVQLLQLSSWQHEALEQLQQ